MKIDAYSKTPLVLQYEALIQARKAANNFRKKADKLDNMDWLESAEDALDFTDNHPLWKQIKKLANVTNAERITLKADSYKSPGKWKISVFTKESFEFYINTSDIVKAFEEK